MQINNVGGIFGTLHYTSKSQTSSGTYSVNATNQVSLGTLVNHGFVKGSENF